jgi:predicted TIM-barrel fold metal-dependent hydrolase
MIDVHVHLAALPEGANGCYISPKMLGSFLFRSLVRRFGLPLDDPPRANRLYLERLVGTLQAARFVKEAVILGIDGVYDAQGDLDMARTDFLIPAGYVLETAARYPGLLRAGVSINPQRRDALAQLDRAVEAGAALVKFLPNTQGFDPADSRYAPFYRAMARHRIPVLTHVGYEFSLAGKDQSVGDPARLTLALDQGVRVIAAHGVSFGLFVYEKYWPTFLALVRDYPNFYWDASALSLPNRVGMLLRIRSHPELGDRMVFGTDYPLSSFAYPALLAGRVPTYLELRRTRNPFDRHYRLLQSLGLGRTAPAADILR